MNYELAKDLKDAGFTKGNIAAEMMEGEGETYYPTLPELIEVVGHNFGQLIRLDSGDKSARGGGERGGWEAVSSAEIDAIWCWASTPEIAVARLWLALNPSPTPPLK